MIHWEILDNKRQELLKKIINIVSIGDYYMIGGTALSLQLGLRESFDFDFCVPYMFSNEVLLEELKTIGNIEVKQNQKGTCDVILEDVQVSFFYYPNEIVEEFVETQEIPNLKLASILDIAIMKVIAIGGRGSRKDFFDLYNILKTCDIGVKQLTEGLKKKCEEDVNYLNIIMGLSYFEDAEEELLPKTYTEYIWEEIKEFFLKFQIEFQKEIEE